MGTSSVSMRDLLGASLVTYNQHLGRDTADASTVALPYYGEDANQPLAPKAVYVQYQSQDPVTGGMSQVVVPASMSLDVYADPKWFGVQIEEEDVVEEEKDDNEEERGQKLRSSIKGDPILMRAKPAPPPDLYLPPQRSNVVLPKLDDGSQGPLFTVTGVVSGGAVGSLFAGSSNVSKADRVLELSDASRQTEALGDARPQSQMGVRSVASSGTMSSFTKAAGKDKYSKSRLSELDQILKSAGSRDGDASSPLRPSSSLYSENAWGSPPSRPGTRDGGSRPMRHPAVGASTPHGSDSAALAANMAMYIQRMPQFHKARHNQAETHGVESMLVEALADGSGAAMGGTGTALGLDEGGLDLAGTDAGRRSPGSKPSHAAAVGSSHGRASRCQDAPPKSGSHMDSRPATRGSTRKQKLRDLDPHIDISETVPTQRLHSNWPDGERRQLARHFYGLTPAQILEEEEKERIRDEKTVLRKKDASIEEGEGAADKDASGEPGGDAKTDEAAMDEIRAAKTKAKRDAERRIKNLERNFARGTDGGEIYHRLEVRIRNISRPERVVVGRPTQRMDQDKFRKCVFLDSLQAKNMGLIGM
jgi:hypothetical protein